MGLSPTFGARRFPKGEWKELWCARRRKPPAAAGGIDAPTTARTVGLPPYGFSPASVPEGFQRASGKPFGAPAGAYPFPAGGNDAPTTARTVGLPPRGGQYFLSKRKKVPKKASGTATPEAAHVAMRRGLRSAGALRAVLDLGSLRSPFREKALDCPFWRRGSLCRAQHDWPDFTCNPARSELAFFRRQNGRAFFPPLPIAALLPRSWR